jgi:Cu(I)/Ag(I) efflux system membrane fusion protein
MKSKLLFPFILFAGLMMVNFAVNRAYGQSQQNKLVAQQTVKYTCPMHPEIVQDHPGNCPICGMKLVEKQDTPMGTKPQLADTTMKMPPPRKMDADTGSMKKEQMDPEPKNMQHDQLKR